MTTDQSELMDCPFCGGKAKHNDGGGSVYGRLWWAVGCNDCGVVFYDREVWDKDKPGMLDLAYPPKECITRWNRRPTPTIAGDRGEALKCLEELANMPLGISLGEWSRLCGPILTALSTPPETIPADDLKTVRDIDKDDK